MKIHIYLFQPSSKNELSYQNIYENIMMGDAKVESIFGEKERIKRDNIGSIRISYRL